MQTGVFYIYKCFTRYEQAEVDSITNLLIPMFYLFR